MCRGTPVAPDSRKRKADIPTPDKVLLAPSSDEQNTFVSTERYAQQVLAKSTIHARTQEQESKFASAEEATVTVETRKIDLKSMPAKARLAYLRKQQAEKDAAARAKKLRAMSGLDFFITLRRVSGRRWSHEFDCVYANSSVDDAWSTILHTFYPGRNVFVTGLTASVVPLSNGDQARQTQTSTVPLKDSVSPVYDIIENKKQLDKMDSKKKKILLEKVSNEEGATEENDSSIHV